MLAVVGAIVVIGVPVGLGIAAISGLAGDLELTTAPEDRQAPGGSDPQVREEVVVPDLDGLDGLDAELAEVLVDVNRSEEQMLATQERFAEVFEATPEQVPDAAVDEALDELAEAAGEGQRELQDIRRDMTAASVDSSQVRELRERYLAHLDAWVRYFVAIESDPELLLGGPDSQPYLQAIDTTGDAFASSVRHDLPDGLDERVRTFADQIVDRGFPGRELSEDDTV